MKQNLRYLSSVCTFVNICSSTTYWTQSFHRLRWWQWLLGRCSITRWRLWTLPRTEVSHGGCLSRGRRVMSGMKSSTVSRSEYTTSYLPDISEVSSSTRKHVYFLQLFGFRKLSLCEKLMEVVLVDNTLEFWARHPCVITGIFRSSPANLFVVCNRLLVICCGLYSGGAFLF